jgi:hypothetical protein
MTGGWRAQQDRVRRWHDRVQAAQAGSQDQADYLSAFFENAFHLRDWLLDTGAVTPVQIKALFDGHVQMRLCRDLANAHKHFSLKKPSQSEPPSEVREYVPGNADEGPTIALSVVSDWKKHDLTALAGEVLRLWDEFISVNVARTGG